MPATLFIIFLILSSVILFLWENCSSGFFDFFETTTASPISPARKTREIDNFRYLRSERERRELYSSVKIIYGPQSINTLKWQYLWDEVHKFDDKEEIDNVGWAFQKPCFYP